MGIRGEMGWLLAVALASLLVATLPLAAQQDATQPAAQTPADAQSSKPEANTPAQTDSTPDKGKESNTDAAPEKSTPAPAAQPQKPVRQKPGNAMLDYTFSESYAVSLSQEWQPVTGSNEEPPPAALSSYAPFHLSGNLDFSNPDHGAILQFATSNNPFIGHDSYWLDSQMHLPSGSGISLLDFFFYYFFPPSNACMHQVLTTYAPASRVSPTDGPAYMQVYYSCPLSDTLSDFYAAQVSAGITFQLTDNGTRVLAPIGDFYVAPMEQIEESGITFFIFEAQDMNAVSSEAANRFHLPASAQGGQPDFFWAIAAASPFPFVADSARKDPAILHVAYARLGVSTDTRTEFMNILRQIRANASTAP